MDDIDSFLTGSSELRTAVLGIFIRALNAATILPAPEVLALTTRLGRPQLTLKDLRQASLMFGNLDRDVRMATGSQSAKLAGQFKADDSQYHAGSTHPDRQKSEKRLGPFNRPSP